LSLHLQQALLLLFELLLVVLLLLSLLEVLLLHQSSHLSGLSLHCREGSRLLGYGQVTLRAVYLL